MEAEGTNLLRGDWPNNARYKGEPPSSARDAKGLMDGEPACVGDSRRRCG